MPRIPGTHDDLLTDDWYAGGAASYLEDETNEALAALRHLWPERLEQLAIGSARGAAVVAPVLRDGIIIARCRDLSGFGNVLARWRQGERSARAEATLAEVLLAHDLVSRFDVPLGSKRLDLEVLAGAQSVFVEIVTPDTAEIVTEATDILKQVADKVIAATDQVHTDILLDLNFSYDQLQTLLEAVQSLGDLQLEMSVTGLATVMKRMASLPVQAFPTLSRPKDGRPLFWISKARIVEGRPTSATVGISISDDRAHRFLSGELHHFSKDHPNILAMETSAVPGGMKAWRGLLEPRLTPAQNRRIGAIVLFTEHLGGEPFRARVSFSAFKNPNAYVPLPEEIADFLQRLDGAEHT